MKHVLFYNEATGKGEYTMEAIDSFIASVGKPYIEIPPGVTMKSPSQYKVLDGNLVECDQWAEGHLTRLREEAFLPKLEFLKRAKSMGFITSQEAIELARGILPSRFTSIFGSMSQEEQDDAELDWAASSMIERLHPVLLAIATYMEVSDNELDLMFDIEV